MSTVSATEWSKISCDLFELTVDHHQAAQHIQQSTIIDVLVYQRSVQY